MPALTKSLFSTACIRITSKATIPAGNTLTKLNAAIKNLHVFAEGFGGTIFEGLNPMGENGDVIASKR